MSDKEILTNIIDELRITSVAKFSKEIGFKTPASLYMILSDSEENKREITGSLIRRIRNRFPQVNEDFLRGKSEVVLTENFSNSDSQNLTINDLPGIMLKVLEEQKKTNELLSQFLKK